MNSSSKLRAHRSLNLVALGRSSALAIFVAIFATSHAQAILDTNSNGMSDLWEKQYNNGNLFPNTFLAANDADQDGWINVAEATAGTNPFDSNPPDGVVVVNIESSLVAGAFTLTWSSVSGKICQLQASIDLVNWTDVGAASWVGQTSHSRGVNTTQPDNSLPPKVFWRVNVYDLDTDGDGLTDAEEFKLGTDIYNGNSFPGIKDLWLATYFSSTLLTSGLSGINMNADGDGDGRTNLEENLDGTNPNEADQPGTKQWVVVRGDAEESVARTRTKQITIPAGKTVIMMIAVASEEYVQGFTVPDETEQYDDVLSWNIQTNSGTPITGQVYVNDRHYDWILAELDGQKLEGIPGPIHHESMEVITAPSTGDLTIDVEISATNVSDGALPSYVAVGFVEADLDIIHPATGELADTSEDVGHGGYVSVQRLEHATDMAPVTTLKLHAIPGAGTDWKARLKFNSGGRYKIYSDANRVTQIVSESTEFSLTDEHTLYFHGLLKSASLGGEIITMEIYQNESWTSVDLVKFTVVQSEFLIQVKAFIPYAWTEGESEIPGPNAVSPMLGKVAKGDLHSLGTIGTPAIARTNGRPASPGFVNKYATSREPDGSPGDPVCDHFDNAPFRVCQTVIITPYEELHASADLSDSRKLYTAPLSEHYSKGVSVHPSEFHLDMGFLDLIGARTDFGKPPKTTEDYRQETRSGKIAEIHIEAGAKDGAMGNLTPLTADIHWDMWLKIDASANPLAPTIQFGGVHDSYPAYEIIVNQSNGNFMDVHRAAPAAGAMPGPASLGEAQQLNVGRTDTITQ